MFFKRYKNLYAFKKYYMKYKFIIIKLRLVMILASSLGMLLPYFISKRLLNVTDLNIKGVLFYSLITIAIIFFHHIFWYYWEKLGSKLNNLITKDIREDILSSLLNTKYSYIKNKTSGYYIERINDDVLEVASFYYNVASVLTDSLTNISFLIFIFYLSYQIGFLFIIGIIVLYIIDLLKLKKDIKLTKEIKTLKEKYSSKINETFSGIREIKGLRIEEEILREINSISSSIVSLQQNKDRVVALYSRIKTFIQHLIEGLIIAFSVSYLIPLKILTIVSLLTIINYIGFMYDLVHYFAMLKDYFVRGDFKAKRILEVVDDELLETHGSKDNKISEYSIKVKDLSYCYEDNPNKKILDNISFEIREKTTNIFIGKSGSGKSTLFGILSRLLYCEDNKVFIGKRDINKLTKKDFVNNICIINQEVFLINDTIFNNIKIVKPDASLKEIENACLKANIHERILEFENGYETLVLENGNNLSGGEKQRIAIARAILRDAPILLFDEPTSALDNINQEQFFKTIFSLKDKTILIIAHKIDDYNLFDNVFEINNGHLLTKK